LEPAADALVPGIDDLVPGEAKHRGWRRDRPPVMERGSQQAVPMVWSRTMAPIISKQFFAGGNETLPETLEARPGAA
jgi:hypothetical protein